MNLYARQGDLVISQMPPVTGGDNKLNYIVAGADTAPHTVLGDATVSVSDGTTVVTPVTDTVIRHAGRHLEVPLPAGYSYSITRLRERGDAGDRAVED